jgi:hypothetical protein
MIKALKITGELENSSDIIISDFYPLGQHIRGIFGYIFLEMGLKISETYTNGNPIIYFRDCMVKHHDGGIFIPDGLKTYKCSVCKQTVGSPVKQDSIIGINIGHDTFGGGKVNSFYNNAVTGKNVFHLEIVVNLKPLGDGKEEERTSEFLSALKFAEESGMGTNVGKRIDKGFGKILVKKLTKQIITDAHIERRSDEIASTIKDNKGKFTIHFLSDIVSKGGLSGEDILRDAKNAAKYFGSWTGAYTEPKIVITRRENDSRGTVEFLDLKIDPVTRDGLPRKSRESVITRGAKFECLIDNGQNLENIYGNDRYRQFFNALATAEMLRGIGDRSSFGKGQFVIT